MVQRSMNQRKIWLILAIILVFSAIIRLTALDAVPPGLFDDEAARGYTAYKIMTTGTLPWPGGTPSLNMLVWLSIQLTFPFVYLFGLSAPAVRLPFALYGIGTVLLTYLLAKEMFNEKVGLLAAFFLAISPWHIQFSRTAISPLIVLVFYFVLTFWLLYTGIKKGKRKYLWLGGATAGLCLCINPIAYVFIPLFLAGFIIVCRGKVQRSYAKDFVIATLLIVFFVIFLLLTSEVLEEFRYFMDISVFSRHDLSPLGIALLFVQNMLAHYSPNYLFLHGDNNVLRSTKLVGELHFFDALLFIPGVILCFRKRKLENKLLLLWLALYPVPASIMHGWSEVPHALHSIFGLPCFQILSAYFLIYVLEHKPQSYTFPSLSSFRKPFLMIVLILIPLCTVNYFSIYFFQYPKYSAEAFRHEYREAVEFIISNNYEDRQIWIQNPSKWPGSERNFRALIQFYAKDKIRNLVIYNHHIPPSYPFYLREPKALALAKEDDIQCLVERNVPFKLLKTIHHPNGDVALKVIEFLEDTVGWKEDHFIAPPDIILTKA